MQFRFDHILLRKITFRFVFAPKINNSSLELRSKVEYVTSRIDSITKPAKIIYVIFNRFPTWINHLQHSRPKIVFHLTDGNIFPNEIRQSSDNFPDILTFFSFCTFRGEKYIARTTEKIYGWCNFPYSSPFYPRNKFSSERKWLERENLLYDEFLALLSFFSFFFFKMRLNFYAIFLENHYLIWWNTVA